MQTELKKKLTPRQRQVLNFIIKYREKKGFPPTIREIGNGVGLSSSSSVHGHLKTLEEMGLISRDPTRPRAIDVQAQNKRAPGKISHDEVKLLKTAQKSDSKMVRCPIYSEYTPGEDFFSPRHVEKRLPLPMEIAGSMEAFIVRMPNESLKDLGVFKDDMCIFHRVDDFDDGDVAAIISGGAFTIKRIYRRLNAYQLVPENRRMNPVYVRDLEILGKLHGVIRISRNLFSDKSLQEKGKN